MFETLQFDGQVNADTIGRPTGVVPTRIRARKAWVNFAPESYFEKLRSVEASVRFEVYHELDDEVCELFSKNMREYIAKGETVDTDELMVQCGHDIALELN